jgi:hypothetical protein
MLQTIESHHFTDDDGNPAGGTTYGVGFTIGWQNGPLAEHMLTRGGVRLEPNGAFVEGVIAAAVDRIEFYQSTKFACDYNAQALVLLGEALDKLQERTTAREARGVEGTHAV